MAKRSQRSFLEDSNRLKANRHSGRGFLPDSVASRDLELIVTEGTTYGGRGVPAHIKGVYLKNIRWEADKPFVIAGVPARQGEAADAHLVEDVTFDDCRVGGKLLTSVNDANFQIEFAKDIKFIASPTASRNP